MNENISKMLDRLSQREEEVVDLLKQGYTREKIAAVMNISKLTYDSYRKSIRNKLNIKNQSDWARLLYTSDDIN